MKTMKTRLISAISLSLAVASLANAELRSPRTESTPMFSCENGYLYYQQGTEKDLVTSERFIDWSRGVPSANSRACAIAADDLSRKGHFCHGRFMKDHTGRDLSGYLKAADGSTINAAYFMNEEDCRRSVAKLPDVRWD